VRIASKLAAAGTAAVAVTALAAGSASAAVHAQQATGLPAGASPATLRAAALSLADGESPFVSFRSFLSAMPAARYASFTSHGATEAVHSPAAFNRMRSYILGMYRGVRVEHSYVDNGSYFDCVVTTTQPTVRALGITRIATPPHPLGTATGKGKPAKPLLMLHRTDAYGDAISCPHGTIPMQRLSLGRMMRFPTLKAFLAKQPGGSGKPTITPGGPHRYAVGYQYVNNYGGNSWLNLWNPSGDFSLSQQWYVAGSGSGTQTVEGGWIHYPAKFGNLAVLFIFFTPNNYSSGCYNLDCTGFVQTSNAYSLGGAWSNYSTYGGTQWGFGVQWQYYQGNWWLFIQNTAIGYYRGSIYGGGPLATGQSNLTEYGGETYTSGTNWPQMGSGRFANAGFGYAAFQNSVFYITPSYGSTWSSLSQIVTNPSCYTFQYHDSSEGSSWGTYFYFGGPGGNC
jgi:Neprosin